ncbi:MAG: aspartate-semialdehyde dehydrogenase [Chloroflexi bacterium]|nr:aspartate-semialdehyde dehydrogenase [Chloroflexota bacterium]
MNSKRKVAVLGATGVVGQRFIQLLLGHPWFEISALTSSERNVGKRFADVNRWHFPAKEVPDEIANMKLQPTTPDLDADIVFSALSESAQVQEAELAKTGHHVFSNVKTHRMDADVPLVIAEVNPDHGRALKAQRAKRGWSGSIVTNGNCSTVHFVLAVAPLHRAYGIKRAVVTTMQSLSGASYPGVASLDTVDNVVPFIGGEEEKIDIETRKFLGTWDERAERFVDADIVLSAHCNRVTVRDGHTETASLELGGSPSIAEVTACLREFRGRPQELSLPSAPKRPIIVRDEPDRPQPLLDRDAENGMASTVGRIREDPVLGVKLVLLGHNTIRGAAGASVLNAELFAAEGLV